MEVQCNMAFRWFVGLDIDSKVWDDSTFARNRCERFEGTDIFEMLFDDTIRRAVKRGWVSDHWSVDGTLVRANASRKSLAAIEPRQSPEEYRELISGKKKAQRTKKRGDDAPKERGRQPMHKYVKRLTKTMAYQMSQRARKKIEELFGEGKEQHCMRRFARRGLERVRQETYLMGRLL